MLTELILKIRDRYHPLFYMRKLSLFRKVMSQLNFPIAIRIDGISHPICVSFSRNLSWVLSNGKVVEAEERASFVRLTTMAGCKLLYDIGANVGLYAFMFAGADANRNAVLFEPDPVNAKLLMNSMHRFAVRNCKLIDAAVSDKDGTLTFHSDSVSGSTGTLRQDNSFLNTHRHGESRPLQVRSVSLDQITLGGAADPDVIKIDAEGAELSIFRGAKALLARSSPMLFFECARDRAEIQAMLIAGGYRLFGATTLQAIDQPVINSVALHTKRHASVIRELI